MSDDGQINIFKALDYIRDTAPLYAKAKAERVYLEEFKKSLKGILMKAAEKSHPSAASQEREAYADPQYQALLEGLREAVEEEEKLRWMIVAAQAKIEVWRSLESSRRMEGKVL